MPTHGPSPRITAGSGQTRSVAGRSIRTGMNNPMLWLQGEVSPAMLAHGRAAHATLPRADRRAFPGTRAQSSRFIKIDLTLSARSKSTRRETVYSPQAGSSAVAGRFPWLTRIVPVWSVKKRFHSVQAGSLGVAVRL